MRVCVALIALAVVGAAHAEPAAPASVVAASAEPAAAPASVVAALPTAEGVVLVGDSGQLYDSSGPLSWKRRGAGGVAVAVQGAVRAGDALVVVGEHTPLFGRVGEAWFARPLPNSGPLALSSGSPALAVDRHVYVPDGGSWRRLISARSRIVALHGSGKQVYVATERGDLAVAQGRRWHTLRSPLPAGDTVAWFAGATGAELYAGSQAGAVLHIDRRRARLVPVPAELSGLAVHAAGAVGQEVYLAGTVGDEAQRRGVLVRATARGLELVDELWPLAEGDRYAAVFAAADAVAVASARGAIRARGADGSWKDGRIDATPPPAPVAAGAASAPARSR